MTQLYAKIKRSSKYHWQNEQAKHNGYGLPFKVAIDDTSNEYCVYGAGNQYCISDLNFFVIVDGHEIELGGK